MGHLPAEALVRWVDPGCHESGGGHLAHRVQPLHIQPGLHPQVWRTGGFPDSLLLPPSPPAGLPVQVFGKELAPAAARGTPFQPHVDTEMEVLKKDGEEGRSLQREVRMSWGGRRLGRREGLLHPWPRQSRCT